MRACKVTQIRRVYHTISIYIRSRIVNIRPNHFTIRSFFLSFPSTCFNTCIGIPTRFKQVFARWQIIKSINSFVAWFYYYIIARTILLQQSVFYWANRGALRGSQFVWYFRSIGTTSYYFHLIFIILHWGIKIEIFISRIATSISKSKAIVTPRYITKLK